MRKIFLLWLVAALLPGCASYALTSGKVAVQDDTAATATLRLTDGDRSILREYFRDPAHRSTAVLGLSVHERLPAGLVRRDVLPGNVRGHTLPYELDNRLTALPAGYVRLAVGRDVVLMHRDSRIVLDIATRVIPE